VTENKKNLVGYHIFISKKSDPREMVKKRPEGSKHYKMYKKLVQSLARFET